VSRIRSLGRPGAAPDSTDPGSLDPFLAVAPEHAAEQARYVGDMFERGAMRPAWCFVAEVDGRVVGRYGFWSLPTIDHPEAIVLLDVVGAGVARDAVAAELRAHALAGASEARSTTLGHVLDDPPQWPQWQIELETRARWLESAGFGRRRATARFELTNDDAVGQVVRSARLWFRDFETIGERASLDAIERVSAGSLDQYTRDERDRLGSEAEARQTFDELRSMEFEPSWWELAFDAGGRLVGLVMSTRAPTFATIGYIGIVPEQRGHGYVNDLLARGTSTLRRVAEGQVIRADTDVDNAPMADAFERAGYRRFATRREFEIRL
jgi:RimJ/RimL family protein N-acetyltransferase